jgi:DNA-binding PadR family transcriptional regulator
MSWTTHILSLHRVKFWYKMILIMETISKQKVIQILIQKKISLLDISTAQKIFSFQKENSLYKFLQRLEKANLLKRVVKVYHHFGYSC